MAYEFITLDLGSEFARITLNRPERRNALSLAHMREIIDATAKVGESDAIGLVIAANGPVFSAGHDFADMAGADISFMRTLLTTCTEMMTLLQSIPQPTIAKVHALATAAGCQLVASCDLAVAAKSAGFATPGGKGGWYCHTPLVAVARNVGRKRAFEMGMCGDIVDAETAQLWGLINYAVEEEKLEEAVISLLKRATRGSVYSKAVGKAIMYRQMDLGQKDAYSLAVEAMAGASQSQDAQEGMSAFLEKRSAKWVGR